MVFETIEKLVSFVKGAKLPDWQRKLFAKNRECIQVHSKGRLYYKIDTLFPNEHPASKAHRLVSFEPITESSFLKGRNNVGRIFKNSFYTAEASDVTIDYITENRFCDKNLFSFLLNLFVEVTLSDDPNAPIVIYPREFSDDAEIDQIVAVKTEHVVHWDKNSIVFKSEDDSDIERVTEIRSAKELYYFDKQEIDQLGMSDIVNKSYSERVVVKFKRTTYHAFVDDMFFRLEQREDGAFDVTEYNLPNNTMPPVIAGGGIVSETSDTYKSFLYPFVPFGNLALLQHSQHTAVNFTFSFPRMSEQEMPCDADQCQEGIIHCGVSNAYPEGIRNCDKCRGTGWTTTQSPYKVYKKRVDFDGVDPDAAMNLLNSDDVKFYTPDTAILDYSKNEWKGYRDEAEAAIFVPQKRDTGNVETVQAKEKDLDQMYAWLLPISQRWYHLIQFAIQQIENDLVTNPIQVSVQQPYGFAILSELEAFELLDLILKSDAPDVIKGNQIELFISKYVSASSPVKKSFEILTMVDPLLLKSDNQIMQLKSNNIVTADQWSVHVFAYPTLRQMYNADKTLFGQENDVIVKKLTADLEKYKPAPSTTKTAMTEQFA